MLFLSLALPCLASTHYCTYGTSIPHQAYHITYNAASPYLAHLESYDATIPITAKHSRHRTYLAPNQNTGKMNSSLPSSICGSASDSSYAATDRSSIRSSSHTSIKSTSTASKPKRTVRFQDPVPEPISSLADSVTFNASPNLSLSSLDLSSDDNASYTRRSRDCAASKQAQRTSSPASRFLSVGRPQIRREMSTSSTASAPGELEFSDWLARMEESRARPGSSLKGESGRASPRAGAKEEAEKEERKKKRRSWVNLLVR